MKKYALLAVVFILLTTQAAEARRRRSFNVAQSNYVSNGQFGLGIELGAPSGLNGKYFLSDSTALNFGVGYMYDRYWHKNRDGFHLYLDHLWHPFVLAQEAAFQLPFYVGVGGRLWSFHDKDNDSFAAGLRVPVGIAFDFNEVPLDIFAQVTVNVDFLIRHDDKFGVHAGASVGIRYWFD